LMDGERGSCLESGSGSDLRPAARPGDRSQDRGRLPRPPRPEARPRSRRASAARRSTSIGTPSSSRRQRIVVHLSVSPAIESGEGRGARGSFDDMTRGSSSRTDAPSGAPGVARLLAAGVAHEVNTPLTGISSYVQLLLEEIAPDDPRRESWRQIEGRPDERGDRELPLQLARPGRRLRGPVAERRGPRGPDLFEPQRRGRNLVVETSLDPDLRRFAVTREVQQLLLNLLLMPGRHRGRGPDPLSTARGMDAWSWRSSTTESGCRGGPVRIFDPFFTTKGRPGHGLGLSITYGIVRSTTASCRREQPGEHTRFRVICPHRSRPDAGLIVRRRRVDAARIRSDARDAGAEHGERFL